MAEKTIMILTKKVFRFPIPGKNILEADGNPPREAKFSDMYFDTKPGTDGRLGEPQPAPAWIQQTKLFKLASDDGDLVVVTMAAKQKSPTENDLQAARNQSKSAEDKLNSPDLDSMTKAQLMDHAEAEHDLELKDSMTKDDMIDNIKKAQKEATKA